VLEVGCGNGANLWAVASEGFATYGIDLAPAGLRLALATLDRRRVRATLVRGDALCLPFREAVFDAAYDVVSLQHLAFEHLRRAYGEVYRVLRPGGRFFSCHMGAATWDHDHGGGRLVGLHTFENMGPMAVGFRHIEIEDVVKSYDGRTRHAQYLIVSCER
jgi:ubiquinone/menaquinone biosynthesis C-methylase UbiE